MSRSQPTVNLVNPAVKFIEWDSENGQFKYWDKENKKNVNLKLPMSFYVLDQLTTIKGFSDKYQGGIWANEIKNLNTQKLKVQTKAKDGKIHVIAEGLYGGDKNPGIRDVVVSAGGKYTRSLYAAMLNDKEEYEIVNFQLKGAAFSGWLDFYKENRLKAESEEVVCKDFKREKKGATKYTIPIFEVEKASEEGNEAAIALDVELQVYLKAYFDKTQVDVEYVEDKPDFDAEDVGEGLPF